ncbi:MAG TPA: PHB depolymerase family esterase [Iamia sp.]
MKRHLRPVAALLVLVAVLAGCGGDDDTDAADDETTTTVDEATDGAADDPAAADAGAGAGAGEEADTGATGPAVPSSGCDSAPHAPVETQRVDTTSGGADRYYLLTAPEDEEPMPLIVDLHGFMEGADVHVQQSALGAYGIDQGFVTAFPHGTGEPVQWDTSGGESADLAFIDAVIDEVAAGRCIDTSRVYATGLSMGAFMTSLLACERADRFAAFAPVNGLQLPEGCQPSRPVPLLTFHGTADPILLFNGGVDTSSFSGGEPGPGATIPPADLDGEGYPATAADWAELQGCTDPVDEAATPVVDRTWTCPDGAAMEFVIIEGQGHGWPGSEFAEQIEAIVGPTVDGVDANERMWEFFQRYQLPA